MPKNIKSSKLAGKKLAIKEGMKQAMKPPHLIVEARAGTGKTTTLIEGLKIVKGIGTTMVPSPQQQAVWESMALSKGVKSVCFVAFNKSIATELQERVPEGCEASTMHSMGFKAVREYFGRGIRVNQYRVQDIISEITGKDIRELRRHENEMIGAVEKVVGLCKMNLVDPTENELEELVSYYDIDLNGSRSKVFELVPQVLERCKDVERDRCIDFDDMIWIPVVLNLPVYRYDLLLVDEAQDLNRCQQSLAKRAGWRLILCGDPKQAIYGFAGADSESMKRMAQELGAQVKTYTEDKILNSTLKIAKGSTITWQSDEIGAVIGQGGDWKGPGCVILPLTVTRRCGKAIVKEAQKIVPDFEAFETNPEGKISNMGFAKDAKDNYRTSVEDGNMILCRVNAPLVSECFKFIKSGRRANIQGRDIGRGLSSTITKLKCELVVDLVAKLSDWHHKETSKELAKRNPNENKVIALQDKYDCIMCFTEGCEKVGEVLAKIDEVFTDSRDNPGIKLSSVHKAKGLESSRVFILTPEKAGMPHQMAKTSWAIEQEYNLKYVAITRAIHELIWVK